MIDEKKEIVAEASATLHKAIIDERDDFLDEQEARKVYAEQDAIIKKLEQKYGGRAWIRECFKSEKLIIRPGITRLGVRGFVAIDEKTGVIVSAFPSRESVEADIKKRAARLAAPGRPTELAGGKRVNVYLDSETLEKASKSGNGNVSEGIRRALKAAKS